jgi:hypothetical protein
MLQHVSFYRGGRERLIINDIEIGSYSGPQLAEEVFRKEPMLGKIYRKVEDMVRESSGFQEGELISGVSLETRSLDLLKAQVSMQPEDVVGEKLGQLANWEIKCWHNYWEQMNTLYNANAGLGAVVRRTRLMSSWEAGLHLAVAMWGGYKKGLNINWDEVDFEKLYHERFHYHFECDRIGEKLAPEGKLWVALRQCYLGD